MGPAARSEGGALSESVKRREVMGEMTLEMMVEVMMEVRAEVMMEVLLPEAPECWVTFLYFSSILSFSPPSPPSSHSSPFPLSGIPVQRKHDGMDD